MNNNRNYGIDLLRLVLMFMVCVLHTLGQGGVLASSSSNPVNNGVFWAMEVFAFCAVDGFALISGYTASNKPKKYTKLVDFWFQTFFYSFIVTLVLFFTGIGKNLQIIDIIHCAFPITTMKYWYMTAYFALFLLMPFLNKYIFSIEEKEAKKMFIIMFIVFSVMGVFFDCFRTSFGYSAIWLIVLYCLGALAKRIKLFENKKTQTLIIIWILSLFITWFVYIHFGDNRLIKHISPTILLNGIIMVILFSRMKLKGTIISKLAPLSLGVYLLQLNPIIWDNVIKNAFSFIGLTNVYMGVLYVLLFSFIIFISGIIVEWLRKLIFKLLKVSNLSEKIVKLINIISEKMFVLIK